MRSTLTLTLFVGMVLAVAMPAAQVSAESMVEVSNEIIGEHCGAEIHCETNAHGEESTVIRAHLLSGPEVTTATCQDEFQVIIETESGDGYIDEQLLNGAQCPNKPCEATFQGSRDGDPWPLHMHETEGENPTHEFGMDVLFCFEPNSGSGPQRLCSIEVGVNLGPTVHQYELESQGAPPAYDGVPCGPGSTPPPAGVRVLEIDGHWITEGGEIEVAHVE